MEDKKYTRQEVLDIFTKYLLKTNKEWNTNAKKGHKRTNAQITMYGYLAMALQDEENKV